MPFWRRGESPTGPPPEPQQSGADQPIAGTLACSERGCTATTGESCGYVDRRGRTCGTAWCPDHQQISGGTVYCRRHAGVVRALASAEGSMPDLENRAPSLVNWVSRDLEEVIHDLVNGYRAELGTDRMIADPVHLTFLGPERLRIWERSWKLVDHTGWGLRVALEVDEARDTEVAVRVGRNVVARVTPPWIEARMRGVQLPPEVDAAQRQEFYRSLTETLIAAIEAELRLRA
jgi:hypothetical protein